MQPEAEYLRLVEKLAALCDEQVMLNQILRNHVAVRSSMLVPATAAVYRVRVAVLCQGPATSWEMDFEPPLRLSKGQRAPIVLDLVGR